LHYHRDWYDKLGQVRRVAGPTEKG
jgi:hypothetical protein